MPGFVESWRSAWRIRAFKDQFLVSSAGLLVALILMGLFLDYVETRSGIVLHDPFLSLFSPADFRWVIYSLFYSGMLLGIVSLCQYPYSFLLAMRAFIVVILLRIACLYLLPLDPPAGSIPLVDPLIQLPGVHPVLTRDLFFSWHTASLTLLVLTARWKDMKIIFTCAAVAVSVFLLLQHAQYTIDVVAAPCFAYVAYGIARWRTVEKMPPPPGIGHADKPKDLR
jgi:hypothetical protein